MPVSKVGRRGQITLPRDIRRTLNIREGDYIAFVQRGDEVVLQPLTQTLADLRDRIIPSVGMRWRIILPHVKNQKGQHP